MSVSTTTVKKLAENRKDGCTCLKKLSKAAVFVDADHRLEVDEAQNSQVKVSSLSLSNESLSQNSTDDDGEKEKRKVLDTLPRYIQILLKFIGIHNDEIMRNCKIEKEFLSQLNEAAIKLHSLATKIDEENSSSENIGNTFVKELKAQSQDYDNFQIHMGHVQMLKIARRKIKEMRSNGNCIPTVLTSYENDPPHLHNNHHYYCF